MENASKKKIYLAVAFFLTICEIVILISGKAKLPISGIFLFGAFFAVSMAVKYTKRFKGLSFTFLIFACCSFTLYFPQLFTDWGFNTKLLIVPSIQIIMFGMGTKLNLGDFVRELKKPVKIIIGTILVYLLMPIAAIIIIKIYGKFPDGVAAGIILVGACPGGVASNVMTYLAKGNLALSMSITTFATLISPLATPLLMLLFSYDIEVPVVDMMISIINLMFVPIGAGIICNKLLYGNMEWTKKASHMILLAIACFIIGFILIFVPFADSFQSLHTGLVLVAWAVAIVSIAKISIEYFHGPENWMDLVLPKLSLSAIMLYIIVVAAHNKETLINIGPPLFVASIAHNFLGFIFGYGSSKALRLNDADTRALTIEVGLKNSGLAVGLAPLLELTGTELAPLFFGTWMNISASSLASFWSQRKPREEQ
ncbi:MAG: bile acid:sodium symporter family protein [Sedimentisphaerales bacterium]|nr:bile acid:sodium symporter family protein [Sedimentisphaerales bacterium]